MSAWIVITKARLMMQPLNALHGFSFRSSNRQDDRVSDVSDACFRVYSELPREASIGLDREEASALRFLSGFSSFPVFQNSEKRSRAHWNDGNRLSWILAL